MSAPSGVRPGRGFFDSIQLVAPPPALAHLLDQITLAWRRMWRGRAITGLVVLSLALGIGVNTAIFSLVDGLFLEPLPFSDPDRLVVLSTTDPKNPGVHGFSYPNFEDVRDGAKTFENLSVSVPLRLNVGAPGEVKETTGELVSMNYFETLGARPRLGSAFRDKGDAVIGHALWRTRFQGDPSITGRTLLVNQKPFRIAGVMPERFRGLEKLDGAEVWIPFDNFDSIGERPGWSRARRALMAKVVGRLTPGVSLPQANTEIEEIAKTLAARYPQTNTDRGFRAMPLAGAFLGAEMRARIAKAAVLLMGVAGLVLLIAIANAGNMLLSRSAGRRMEMAVRLAMGASRRHFFTQVFTESALLVLVAGGLGLALGIAGRDLLWSMRPEFVSSDDLALHLNLRVLAFVLALSVLTGMLANLFPVWQTLRGDVAGELKQRDGCVNRPLCIRIRGGLVTAQVALSLVAMVAAQMFVKSHNHARELDPGFETTNLALVEVNPRRLGMSVSGQLEFYRQLRGRLAALPGVRSVAVASDPAIGFHRYARTVRVGDTQGAATFSPVTSVTEGYFETTDILLLRGRDFGGSNDDKCCPLEAILSESAAQQFFGDSNPVGRRFRLFGDPGDRVVVGVARNTAYAELAHHDKPLIYVPIGQDPPVVATFHIRTAGDPQLMAARIEREIRAAEPRLPAPEVRPVTRALEDARWTPRMAALLLATFALMAMFLAAMGVYGVTSHAVKQRTGEIGARMAMGASPMDVTQLILRQASRLVLPGLAIGGAAAFALAHRFEKLFLGVRETDMEPYLVASILLATAAAVATWLPARRAVRMMPAAALRQD